MRRAGLAPAGDRWQIMIVEDSDRLTEQACNALLKAIEEPTARTVWLLCAPTVEDVLPTIRSRCRLVTLSTPPADEVAAFLVRTLGVGPELAASAARASQGHIGRARALARDEETRLRRRQVVQIPARLTSVGACMQAATNVSEIAKDEAEAITTELDAREKKDLDAAYGVVERGRRPREYSPALSALEKDQKTRAKRRILDVADRCLMDLTSVYRDAIALSVGAPGALVNEEMRAEIDAADPADHAGGAAADDRCDLHRARADAGVQRAAAAGARVDDGGPAAARGSWPVKKILVWVVVVALVAGTVAARRCGVREPPDDPPSRVRPRRGRRPSAARRRRRRPAPSPELEPFYAQQLDWESCDDDFECATLEVPLNYSEPDGRDDRARAAQGAGARREPGRARGQPGRAGCARHRLRRRGQPGLPRAAAPRLRHRRLRPARHRRLGARSTA